MLFAIQIVVFALLRRLDRVLVTLFRGSHTAVSLPASRLSLEVLEERVALTAYTVITAADDGSFITLA